MQREPIYSDGDYEVFRTSDGDFELEYKGEVIGSYPSQQAAMSAILTHEPEPPSLSPF